MRKNLFILLFVIIITSLYAIEKLEGYKDYKFGMTIEEADSIYDFDKPISPENLKHYTFLDIDYILFYNTKIYNEKAEVYIYFKNKHLDHISITFRNIKRSDIKYVSNVIAKKLKILYNLSFDNLETLGETSFYGRWIFLKGGILEFDILVSEDVNEINVFYGKSDHL